MKFEIILGDITTIATDALVNPAKESLLSGGGVDGAIHRAAGAKLLEECLALHGCETGYAKATGAYNLPAKYVLHTPTPIWRGGLVWHSWSLHRHAESQKELELLASCYRQCLLLAHTLQCHKITFPSIGTGSHQFPLKKAASIALHEIFSFTGSLPEQAVMVCLDKRTLQAYQQEWKNMHKTNW